MSPMALWEILRRHQFKAVVISSLFILCVTIGLIWFTTMNHFRNGNEIAPMIEDVFTSRIQQAIAFQHSHASSLPDDSTSTTHQQQASQGSSSSLKREQYVQQHCPSWSFEFTQRFVKECGFWIDRIQHWKLDASITTTGKAPREVGFLCSQDQFCSGWGDRVGGISSAFYRALESNAQLVIGMAGISNLISPCLLPPDLIALKNMHWNDTCKGRFAGGCDEWLAGETCQNADKILGYNLDRPCTPDSICAQVVRDFPSGGAGVSNVFGCAMRMLFEPSNTLKQSVRYPFRIGLAPAQNLTLEEMEFLFDEKYYVISVHVRVGDLEAFLNGRIPDWTAVNVITKGEDGSSSSLSLMKKHFWYAFHCAATIESLFNTNEEGETYAPDGRPIRWFVASDSFHLKDAVREMFPTKVLTMDLPAKHVSMTFAQNPEETLAHTMTEWYLIGRGEELIVNKLNEAHPGLVNNNFQQGRVSGFAKTSRAYHLKNDIIDAATCLRYTAPTKGTWKHAGCPNHFPKAAKSKEFDQSHLLKLTENGLKFPKAWVLNGKIQKEPRGRLEEDDDREGASSAAILVWTVHEAQHRQMKSPQERKRNLFLWSDALPQDEEAIRQNMNMSLNLTCVPKICVRPKDFFHEGTTFSQDKPIGYQDKKSGTNSSSDLIPDGYVYLASFPGSGNTWLRSIIEQGSRIFTGSDYDDLELKETGFIGEGPRFLYGSTYPRVSVVKTHYPLYQTSPDLKISSFLVLMRCPFDALLAEFNREYSMGHTTRVSTRDTRQHFPAYFRKKYAQWVYSVRYFMRKRFFETSVQWKTRPNNQTGTLPLRLKPFTNDLRIADSQKKELVLPALVIFYEDLVEQFELTVKAVFSFLKQRLGRAMPTTSTEAAVCAYLEHLKRPRKGKRRNVQHEKEEQYYNPYTDTEGEFQQKPWYIESFCEDVAEFWVEEKWGPCREPPYLQSARGKTVVALDDKAQVVRKLCQED